MSTRKELIAATELRYGAGTLAEKRMILEEFVGLTGYHRKHAIRILNQTNTPAERKPRDRTYDEAVKQALVFLWEASDRLCGKRLKVQIPILIEALERHGKLSLDPTVKTKLLQISASSIDPVLSDTRQAATPKEFWRVLTDNLRMKLLVGHSWAWNHLTSDDAPITTTTHLPSPYGTTGAAIC